LAQWPRLDSAAGKTYVARYWHSFIMSAKALQSITFSNAKGRLEAADEDNHGENQVPATAHDRVVVKRVDAEEKSKGGIIIPDTAKEKPQEGEVVAVGPGGRDENGKLIEIGVKAGDRVLLGKWSGPRSSSTARNSSSRRNPTSRA